jgi:hypothetical protein
MKIKYVTLTGADDRTDATKMAELSSKFKFAEWAILFSKSKAGVSRYPSTEWIEKSLPVLSGANLSAHLCGKWVDDANNGNITFFDDKISDAFQRIQLNMAHGRLNKVLNLSTELWGCHMDRPIIIGGPYQKYNLPIPTHKFFQCSAYILFDCSGGRGVLADEWPSLIYHCGKPMLCGYAGGLNPDNLEEELIKIEAIVGDAEIWIDMESGVRNNDEFDLKKCERVLVTASRWVDNAICF